MFHKKNDNILTNALFACKRTFQYTLLFSMLANILMLALPIYSLQVLDRVVSSGSMETLTMLTLVTIGFLITYAIIQGIRSLILIRVGEWMDQKLSPDILKRIINISATTNASSGSQPLRDVGSIKNFLTGPGLSSLLDLPWSLIYLAVIFAIHPVSGFIAAFGAIVLFGMAIWNEYATGKPLKEANKWNIANMHRVEMIARNAEVIEAMGMASNISHHWKENQDKLTTHQLIASHRANFIGNISKFFRMALQIIIIASGAYYMLTHEMTTGGIIASSILLGRVLAPFEGAITSWKSLIQARQSYERLSTTIERSHPRDVSMQLPEPTGKLSAETLIYAPPGKQKPTVRGISFQLPAGESVGLVGPSAAGKSTLAKLIMGVYKPIGGIVRLDDADVYTWNRDNFGQHVGYLPQDVELFAGTVKDNIARLDREALAENVVEAAKMAGVHEMILHLPNGYETDIGEQGSSLSAGQRQRIGLARAFYGNPKLVVLDEPNANLDQEGEEALRQAILRAKQKNITLVIIAHRPSVLAVVDKIMVLRDGQIIDFGPRAEVMARITPQPTAVPQSNLQKLGVVPNENTVQKKRVMEQTNE